MNPSTRTLIQSVSQYWKGFDLDSKRVMLDAQGVSMQEQKENCLKSRKALAEHTKRFRKLADNEKLPAMASLLKAYQEEIDTLTKRAKYSDNAFFALYKALYEAPDPVPALDALDQVIQSTTSTESDDKHDEVGKLRKELQAYEAEFATLKNQDITIRKLETKLQTLEDNMERMVEEQVEERSRELEGTIKLKEEDIDLRQSQLDKSLAQARKEREDALAQLDLMRSEVFQAKQRHDHLQAMHAQETQGLLNEMERLRTMQVENQVLRQKLESITSTTASSTPVASTLHFELEVAQKDAQLTSLQRELQAIQASSGRQEQELKAQINELQQQVDELSERPTMESFVQLQTQLHQRIAAPKEVDPRVLKLEQQLDAARQQSAGQHTQINQLTEQIRLQEGSINHLQGVISQLEAALEAASQATSVPSNILGEVLEVESGEKEMKLLTIMRQQRDRLKEKLKDMDGELHAANASRQQLTTRLKQLEHENIDLVQKMRYVSNSTGATPDIESAGSLPKYQSLYEERMNPFDQFKQMENAARVAQLNPLDKILLISARLILSHPFSRMGLLIYLLLLHLLVVSTLYMSMHLCNVSNST